MQSFLNLFPSLRNIPLSFLDIFTCHDSSFIVLNKFHYLGYYSLLIHSPNEEQLGCYQVFVKLLCALRHLLTITVSWIFLIFDELDSGRLLLRYFVDYLSIEICLMIFIIRLGLWVWRRNIKVVKFYIHHIKTRVHTIEMAYC